LFLWPLHKAICMTSFLLGVLLQVSPDIPLQSILKSSSQQADEINTVTNYFFWTAGFMLLVVAALTAYILYKFRQSSDGNNAQKEVNRKWEIPMIGVPLALVGIFLYLTVNALHEVHPDTAGKTPDVVITGHQWWWEAAYSAAQVTTANEIYLPAGKKILLKLLAADVIHDWWVPQFGSKMDMIHGRYLRWVNSWRRKRRILKSRKSIKKPSYMGIAITALS
jgi:cytochrome c oxidase subunit II